jgi:hypothetical protein
MGANTNSPTQRSNGPKQRPPNHPVRYCDKHQSTSRDQLNQDAPMHAPAASSLATCVDRSADLPKRVGLAALLPFPNLSSDSALNPFRLCHSLNVLSKRLE